MAEQGSSAVATVLRQVAFWDERIIQLADSGDWREATAMMATRDRTIRQEVGNVEPAELQRLIDADQRLAQALRSRREQHSQALRSLRRGSKMRQTYQEAAASS
ncbi:MAG: hypothetical protein AAGF46_01555 [Pseudomonadota bacterium]